MAGQRHANHSTTVKSDASRLSSETTLMPKVERLGEILGQVHDLDCVKATAELHPR